jgi:serine/threonine-protein kinase
MSRSWPIVTGLTVVLGLALAVWRLGFLSAVPRPLKHLSIDTPPVAPIAISRDGSRLVHTVRDRDDVVLQVRSVDGASRLRLRGARGASAPFFSGDGAWVGFVSDDSLMKVRSSGGKIELVASVEDYAGASWAARDEIVFAARAGLNSVPASGGNVYLLASPADGERGFRWPHAVPGGAWVLFEVTLDSGPSRIDAISLDTGDRRPVMHEASLPRYAVSDHLLFVRGGALWGVAIDPARMEILGEPRLLVPREESGGSVWYDISTNGTLVLGYPAPEGASLFTLVVHWNEELIRLAPIEANTR